MRRKWLDLIAWNRRNHPVRISHWNARPRRGECPWCRASEDVWCFDGCTSLDMADYR